MPKLRCCLLFILTCSSVHATPEHPCANAAMKQAQQLLSFHTDTAERIEIDPNVKILPDIRNPANAKQRFSVLELWGYVYKGQYRMRLIYAQTKGECLLLGQEILEYANL